MFSPIYYLHGRKQLAKLAHYHYGIVHEGSVLKSIFSNFTAKRLLLHILYRNEGFIENNNLTVLKEIIIVMQQVIYCNQRVLLLDYILYIKSIIKILILSWYIFNGQL